MSRQKMLIVVTAALASLPAFAAPTNPMALRAKANQVNQLIQQKADQLSGLQLDEIDRTLSDLRAQVMGVGPGPQPGPGPNPYPNPGPGPNPYPNPGPGPGPGPNPWPQPGPGPGPGPNPWPNPGPGPGPGPGAAYSIRARIETVDVAFDGYGLDAVDQQCLNFVRSANIGQIDEVWIRGNRVYNQNAYWSAETVCALLTLNADRQGNQGGAGLSASIENLPIQVQVRDYGDLDRVIDTLVPQLVAGQRVDELTINGQRVYNQNSYYTPQQVAAIIKNNVVLPWGSLISQGTVEEVPFVFTGNIGSDIENRCLQFVSSALAGRQIDQMVVNGQSRYNQNSYWSPAEICMTIKTLAVPR